MISADLGRGRVGGRVELARAGLDPRGRRARRRRCTGSVFLWWTTSDGSLPVACSGAPDPEQVVVELEGEAERPAEAAIAGDDLVVLGGEDGAGLDRGGDERRGLAADHVEVAARRVISSSERAHRDVDVLALAQRQARLVVQAHQAQDRRVGEAEVGQPVERDPRQAEQRVAGVDRLGDAVDGPQRRPVAALDVAVLDVVVDEAEVVAELDRRGAGQRALVLAGDAGVGEQAEQRPHPLAGRRARAVEREVVADHLVQPVGGRIADPGRAGRSRASVSAMSSARSISGEVVVIVAPSVHETCSAQVA